MTLNFLQLCQADESGNVINDIYIDGAMGQSTLPWKAFSVQLEHIIVIPKGTAIFAFSIPGLQSPDGLRLGTANPL